MNEPEFSFALPVLNGAASLERTLRSLQAQSLESIQVIVADNDSNDETAAVAKYFAERDSRFRYVHGERVDVNANFARALDYVESDYVAWAAHDDVWHPDFAGRVLDELKAGYQVVIPNWWIGDLNRGRGRQQTVNPLHAVEHSDPVRRLFVYLNLPLRSHKANVVYSGFHLEYLRHCQSQQSMADDGTFSAFALFHEQPSVLSRVLFYKDFRHEGIVNRIHEALFSISRGTLPRRTARSFAAAKRASCQNLSRLWPEWADLFDPVYENLSLFDPQMNSLSDEALQQVIALAHGRVE